jgi:[ribosomal protein S5]-alanine N-acetyltransferase
MQIKPKDILLVPFSDEFISEDYISWLNDNNKMQFSEQQHINHTYESCFAYYNSFKNSAYLLYALKRTQNIEGFTHLPSINLQG